MDAKIIIKSIIDGEELESSNNGSVTFLGDVTLLSYKEDVDGDEIKTNIEISDGSVKVEKHGAVTSSMHFLLGEKTDMLYSTPIGDMAMRTLTESFAYEISDKLCTAEIYYNLYNNSALISSHKLKIRAEIL